MNRLFLRRVGLSEEEVVGRLDVDILDEETARIIREEERKVLESGVPVADQRVVRTPVGTEPE